MDQPLLLPPVVDGLAGLATSNDDDDDIIETLFTIQSVATSNSRKEKEKRAVSHFNMFLQRLHGTTVVTKADDLTYDDLTPDLFSKFAYYLTNTTKYSKDDGSKLAMNTAIGYFSAIKMYFTHKFQHLPKPPAFERETWSRTSHLIVSRIIDRCKASGQSLVQPKPEASTQDWLALASTACWQGDMDQIEFWHMCVSMCHLAGRGTEMSYSKYDHIKILCVNENGFQYDVLQVHINNWKTASAQELTVFPHRDHWQLCWYFSFAMLLTCTLVPGDYIFPQFSNEALKENGQRRKKACGVSVHWKNCYQKLLNWYERHEHHLTEDDVYGRSTTHLMTKNLCSHSGKKYALREMAGSLTPVEIIFRAGWEMRNAHTLFDYLIRDQKHDGQAGKVLAGWTTSHNGCIIGGYPPTIESFRREADLTKFRVFYKHLFQKAVGRMEDKILSMLGLTVLQHYTSFKSTMELDPSGKYRGDQVANHIFLQKVKISREHALVSEDDFEQWQKDVVHGFIRRNALAMPPEILSTLGDEREVMVDSRPIIEQMVDVTKTLAILSQSITANTALIHELMRCSDRTDRRVSDGLQRIEALIGNRHHFKMNQGLLPNELLQQPHTVPTGRTSITNTQQCLNVVPYCNLMDFRSKYGPQDLFKVWFTDDLVEAYNRTKTFASNTDDFKKYKCMFARQKKAMKFLIKACGWYPADGERTPMWHCELNARAILAEEIAKELLSIAKNKKLTLTDLGKTECSRDWPSNMPQCSKDWFDNGGNNPHGKRKRDQNID